MNFFLRAKHWQLFLLIVLIPFLLQNVVFSKYIGRLLFPDNEMLLKILNYIISVIASAFLIGWKYSVGTALYKKLPAGAKMNLTRFKWLLGMTVISSLSFAAIPFWQRSSLSGGIMENLLLIMGVVLVCFFFLTCSFYCIYFLAKSLKAVEFELPVSFSDYVGDAVLILFFFIGVWFLQPKINGLFAENQPVMEEN